MVERREGPGRPEHVWTLENSHKINLLFAVGYDVKDAARAVGITAPTLRKHYFSEVARRREARLRLTARQLALLAKQAEDGKVAAVKEIFKRLDKGALDQLAAQVAKRGERPVKPKAPGKKEAASIAANAVGGKFAPPAAPLFH